MRKKLLILFIFLQISLLKSVSSLDLDIYRSKSHKDKSGKLTPLVISVSSDDTKNKKN